MIWEISQDVIGQNQPLLYAISTQLLSSTGVAQISSDPKVGGYVLYDNYPNPFNPSTTIRFALPQGERVSMKVFDVMGREVATLLDEYRDAGTSSVQFDAAEYRLASGVYVCRIMAGNFMQSNKFVLMK